MRPLLLMIALFVAGVLSGCEPHDPEDPAAPAKPGKAGAAPLVLRAARLPEGTGVSVDGKTIDAIWRTAAELRVPLAGKGPKEVRLKAAYDGARFYLQAIWNDDEVSLNWFWRYMGKQAGKAKKAALKFEEHKGEDAFALMLSPGGNRKFAQQGCAMACHVAPPAGGQGKAKSRHVWPGEGRGVLDYWYWGAQTTQQHPQARDLWLRRGKQHRLRGDGQPDKSDNLDNISTEFIGPKYVPFRIRKGFQRVLFADNVNELTRDILTNKISGRKGWEIPHHILRSRKGSRGDVVAKGLYHKGRAWVLELSRPMRTGNTDDLPLVPDPLVSRHFAVAVWDGGTGASHARSGVIELKFLPVR